MSEFEKYAVKHCGISSLRLHDYRSASASYVNPMILEERQLNVTQLDVFSRLMMDRILFLGTPIDDDVANIIQAQLLFLESVDPSKDIQLYVNSPGGSVSSGLGYLRYDATGELRRRHHLYRHGGIDGCRAAYGGCCRQAFGHCRIRG